jgi:hypothetical protein
MTIQQMLLGGSGESGYNLTRSLRFRRSASAYLSKTFSNPPATGLGRTWTLSKWVKRGALGLAQNLYSSGETLNTAGSVEFNFNSNNTVTLTLTTFGLSVTQLITTQVFRDPSAWYHIVLAIDTTQATASNRAKIYVNGTQVTAFSTANYPSQNEAFTAFTNYPQNIGRIIYNGTGFFDGYMTEIVAVDGQALTPSSFGAFSPITGVWQPAAYTGTYGTNGFYLPFTDNSALTTSSNVGLGKDFSGNGNYWTTNNISITAGVTYDSMTDVPTLTSATASNFPTLNPLAELFYPPVLKNANLTTNAGIAVHGSTMFFPTTGKFYVEFTIDSRSNLVTVGLCNSSPSRTQWLEYTSAGNRATASGSAAYGASYTTGDVIGMAVDCTGSQVTFYKNNSSQGAIALSVGSLTVNDIQSQIFNNTSGDVVSINFGQRPFAYTPPTGFVALNTFNLPASTIVKGNTVMDATLYTGNGSSQSIVNAAAFRPDFVWLKSRSNATDNILVDSVRGSSLYINSNTTSGETSDSTIISAINSNGFSVGSNSGSNANAATFVGWQWQAGQGSSSSNTAGSITSTVSVNASAGFSVVTYTGTGANATVGHGLGVAPKMIIVKRRNSTSDWYVYHVGMATPSNNTLFLNSTSGNAASTAWNNTSPTSSVFSIGTLDALNNSGSTYVAYCWSEIDGFSKFGSYTGNGSTDGVFIYLGFRPKYFLVKRTNSAANWCLLDTSRNLFNVASDNLSPNLSGTGDTIYGFMDFVSNGIKLRNSDGAWNASGGAYVYAAFAENPTKYSLAR